MYAVNTNARSDMREAGKTGREKADSLGDGRSKAAGDPIGAHGEPETVDWNLSFCLMVAVARQRL